MFKPYSRCKYAKREGSDVEVVHGGDKLFLSKLRHRCCHVQDVCRVNVLESHFDFVANAVCERPRIQVSSMKGILKIIVLDSNPYQISPQNKQPQKALVLKYASRIISVELGPTRDFIESAAERIRYSLQARV